MTIYAQAHNTPLYLYQKSRNSQTGTNRRGKQTGKQTVIERMDGKKLRAFLKERIRFEKEITKKEEVVVVTADLPLSVADHILARASWPFPKLMEVIRNPSLDLTIGEFDHFDHADAGQMNFYLNYLKREEVKEGKNPPIEIILCASKDKAFVEFALGDLENSVFVSKYQIYLPTKQELLN